jgi:hypothetical protein
MRTSSHKNGQTINNTLIRNMTTSTTSVKLTHLEQKVSDKYPMYSTMRNQKLKKLIVKMFDFGSNDLLDVIPTVISFDELSNTLITERLKSLFLTDFKKKIAHLETQVVEAENKLHLAEDIIDNASLDSF